MSELHCRGCDCESCLPGHPAAMTQVYSTAKHPVVRCKQCGTETFDRFAECWMCAWLPIAADLPRASAVHERIREAK
jgi:hypothetical protein